MRRLWTFPHFCSAIGTPHRLYSPAIGSSSSFPADLLEEFRAVFCRRKRDRLRREKTSKTCDGRDRGSSWTSADQVALGVDDSSPDGRESSTHDQDDIRSRILPQSDPLRSHRFYTPALPGF